MRTIVGLSGASGAQITIEFLKRLGGEKYLILSKWGRSVLAQETGLTVQDLAPLVDRIYSNEDMNAPFASGSTSFDHFVVLPCSVTTLARISQGLGDNLITRVAEVALKEKRNMLLGLRETPLSAVALENALKLARLGVTIMPLSPAFYFKETSPQEMTQRFVDHLLTTLKLPSGSGWRERELPVQK